MIGSFRLPTTAAAQAGSSEPTEWTQAYYEATYADAMASYTRPADWLTLPTVNNGEQKVVILMAIFDNGSNWAGFTCSGDYTVNWGDGTTSNHLAFEQANYLYNYSTISTGTLSTRGYKQVIVTITPQAGQNLTIVDLYTRNSNASQPYANRFLDIKAKGSLITNFYLGGSSNSTYSSMLEIFSLTDNSNNMDCGFLFRNCYRLQKIEFSPIIDGARSMFEQCYSLKAIPPLVFSANISALDFTFSQCYSLLAVPAITVSSLTSTTSTFVSCTSLKFIPLFDTSLVSAMPSMFSSCNSLISVPAFNTASASSTSFMFNGCSNLTSIPLLNTAQVIDMSSMFSNCFKLTTIPQLDTSLVSTFVNTFNGCAAISSIPLLNTVSATNMSNMFLNCKSLRTVPLMDTQNVLNMTSMFSGCNELEEIPLLNMAKVTNMSTMFASCFSLRAVPALNTALVTNPSNTFSNCFSLIEIPALNFNAATSFSGTFSNCSSLSRIKMTNAKFNLTLSNLNLSAAALDEIYTNLPTVTGRTISVSGNWGTATDNPSIASAKGWTVSG